MDHEIKQKVGFVPAFNQTMMLASGFAAVALAVALVVLYHPATLVAQMVQLGFATASFYQGLRWIGDYYVTRFFLVFTLSAILMAIGVFLSSIPSF